MLHPITDSFGFMANILSNIAFIPQIIKSYRLKQVKGVSIGMFLILFATQVCWITYAIPLGDTNLWTSSLIEIILLLPILIMWFLYNKNNEAKEDETIMLSDS